MAFIDVNLKKSPPSGGSDASAIVNGITIPGGYTLPTLQSLGLKFGTGAGKINLLSELITTTLMATPLVIDLTTSLVDGNGNLLNMVRPKVVVIYNLASTPGFDLLLGGNGTTPWVAPFNGIATVCGICKVGCLDVNGNQLPGCWESWAPDAVGFGLTGTAKLFKIDPGANNVPIAYFFAGCNA